MKFKYTKFVPSLLDDLDMEDLVSKLSDLLLSSGFNDPNFSGTDDDRTMQALHDAILEALMSGGVLPEELMDQLLGENAGEFCITVEMNCACDNLYPISWTLLGDTFGAPPHTAGGAPPPPRR